MLTLREGCKSSPFEFKIDYPEPYVPRQFVKEVTERVTQEGKILTPLDKALNIIHLHEPVRKVYFALADSRERLIQFTSLPNHEITKNLMPILIQMNRLLNTISRLRQDDPFDERKEFQIVEHIIKWRSLTKDVILELSGGSE